jgi:hypothetical protein
MSVYWEKLQAEFNEPFKEIQDLILWAGKVSMKGDHPNMGRGFY